MATRSTIAIRNADNTVTAIYCHWDGYLSHNGKILFENYNTEEKVRELIALGDLSVLGPEIGTKHSFDNPHEVGSEEYYNFSKQCTAYGRDRGEKGVGQTTYENWEDMYSQEFNYIFETSENRWYVSYYDGMGSLEEELNKEKEIA